MKRPSEILVSSEQRLNALFTCYKTQEGSMRKSVCEFLLQAAIFQYEVSTILYGILQNQPRNFARKVAFKDLAHKLYEYSEVFNSDRVRQLTELAKELSFEFSTETVKDLRKNSLKLKTITCIKDLRNSAGGHYDKDISKILHEIDKLNEQEVMDIHDALMEFNKCVIEAFLHAANEKRV